MKKLFMLICAALFTTGLLTITACGDDDKAKCSSDDAQACLDESFTCSSEASALMSTDPDGAQAAAEACTQEFCDCIDNAGCDISEWDKTGVCE